MTTPAFTGAVILATAALMAAAWDGDHAASPSLSLPEEIATARALIAERDSLARRREEMNRIVIEVMADRLSLASAVEQFKDVARREQVEWRYYPGATVEEKAARNVVVHAMSRLEEESADSTMTRERLSQEFNDYLRTLPPAEMTGPAP